MGLWERHLLPRVINACNYGPHVKQVRQRMCAGLAGEVVEIGFGSGLDAPYYPAAVSRVLAVEPSDVGWGLAAGRVTASRVPVERIVRTGGRCRWPTTASTLRCRPGRCAPSPTRGRRWRSCAACSSPAVVENEYEKGAPEPIGYLHEGTALSPV